MLQNTFGARQMEPRFGFQVYKTSVKLFEKHPLQIFLLGLVYLLFIFFYYVAPLFVQLFIGFVMPAVSLGVLRCLREFDSTLTSVSAKRLSDIFFDPTRKEDYVILGGVNVGYTALWILLTYAGNSAILLALLFVFYTALTFFAYPLIEFDRVKPIEAIKASLQISKLNWKVGAVYLLATLLFMVMSICALGVGFFIFFPLMFISRYVSYQIILNK